MTVREFDERESLLRDMTRASEKLCDKRDRSALGLALRTLLPTVHHAFIVRCVPEQSEDIYWLLVSPREIVRAEIHRDRASNEKPVMSLMGLDEFRRNRLSREVRDRLRLALELIRG